MMKKQLSIIGSLIFAMTIMAAQAQALSWSSTFAPTGTQYAIVNNFLSWESAKTEATAAGGWLATITSEAENDFVLGLGLMNFADYSTFGTEYMYSFGYWIGGSRAGTSGDFTWENGEGTFPETVSSTPYTNWLKPYDPNGQMYVSYAQRTLLSTGEVEVGWVDDNSPTGFIYTGYIIERAAVPEPGTMLLFGTGIAGIIGAIRRRNKK